MKCLTLLLLLPLAFPTAAHAQNAIVLPGGCGTASYVNGVQQNTQTTGGSGCVTPTPPTVSVVQESVTCGASSGALLGAGAAVA